MPRIKNAARQDGRVQTKLYIGIGDDGRKKYKYIYAANNAELQRKLDEQKALLGKGIDLSAARDTFRQWGEMWCTITGHQL